MELKDQCCTVEQGKRLRELGVSAECLYYHYRGFSVEQHGIVTKEWHDARMVSNACYPAYTVAELLELMPFGHTLIHNGHARKDGVGTLIFDVYETPHIEPDIDYRDDPPTPYGRKCVTPTDWFLKSFGGWAEAAAEYLIYLLENNLITPNEINKAI